MRTVQAVTLVLCLLPFESALADDPPRCSPSSPGTTDAPSGRVFVEITSMHTNGDMEPDFLFYDNRSDIFGKVTINADGTPEAFDLPELEEQDDPHWSYGNHFVSRPAIAGQPVHIVIDLDENDWFVTGSNDSVDVNPGAGDELNIDFDTCSLRVSGDVTGSAGTIIVPSSGTSGNQGVLTFRVGMEDGRAVSTVTADVALQGFDVLQVLPSADRIVSEKPLVGLVTVANNTPAEQPVSVRFRVLDDVNNVLYDAVESLGLPLAIGEVRSAYLATSTPVIPSNPHCKPAKLYAQAQLVLESNAEDPGGRADCWVVNNSSAIKQWDLVTTKGPSLLWVRTGHVLSANSLATMSELNDIRDKGMPFIRGVYPAATIDDSVSSFPLVPLLSGGVFSYIASLINILGLPLDAATPYAMVLELNAAAAISGNDRLMGALPKDWFDATLYGILEGVTGLSLGELAPRAVIFESVTSNDSGIGPKVTLPAHELGHTYGLSLDPSIKSWWCSLDGDLGVIACGIAGGFDEYHSDVNPDGVPTWGYWIPQGPDAPVGREGEQCDATCMMGNTPINAYDTWYTPKLVDALDYNRLIDKLISCNASTATTALYISGVIAADDSMEMGWTFVQPNTTRSIDLADEAGEWQTIYGIVLADSTGKTLSEAELPLMWPQSDTDIPLQATFFGGYIPYPTGTAKISIVNRDSGKIIGERLVSKSSPKVSAPSLAVNSKTRTLEIAWSADDSDKDKLYHFVHVSPDRGVHWWPIAHGLTDPEFAADLTDVAKGSYLVRVLTSDGVNVSTAEGTVTL